MNAERARQIIEAYGADPARWPADERVAMGVQEGMSTELSATLASATTLDTLLDALPGADASLGLVERVMSAAPGASPENKARRASITGHRSLADWLSGVWPWEPVLRPAAALAFSALFGVTVGIFSEPPSAANMDEPDLTWELAFAPAAIVTEDM